MQNMQLQKLWLLCCRIKYTSLCHEAYTSCWQGKGKNNLFWFYIYFAFFHALNSKWRNSNVAARLLSGMRKYQHISPTLAALHWLPIRFRIDFKVLMMMYKALNGLGPRYLADHLLPPRSTRITWQSQQGRLRGLTPREARKERTRNWAFSAVAPRLWNNLPTEIHLAPSLGVFKSHLNTWLFRQAFPPVN